jgi:hypothetical protein
MKNVKIIGIPERFSEPLRNPGTDVHVPKHATTDRT